MTTTTQEEDLHRLLSACGALTPEERDAITQAYCVASHAHEGTVRRSGEPFVTHPLAVARIVAEMHLETEVILAALLHDVAEDAGYSLSALRRQFGASVAFLVDAVSVPQAEDLPRFLLHTRATHQLMKAMETDKRAGWLKLADRLHNMHTLQALSLNEQEALALETLTFYVPLAHHLGAVTIQRALETLAWGFLRATRENHE